MTRGRVLGALALVALVVGCAGGWWFRWLVVRVLPMRHTGVVNRVGGFEKPVNVRFADPTRTGRQWVVVFEDGFNCEGWDSTLAAVQPGDTVEVVGFPDVKGFPLLDPDWWSCAEVQLVHVSPRAAPPPP